MKLAALLLVVMPATTNADLLYTPTPYAPRITTGVGCQRKSRFELLLAERRSEIEFHRRRMRAYGASRGARRSRLRDIRLRQLQYR